MRCRMVAFAPVVREKIAREGLEPVEQQHHGVKVAGGEQSYSVWGAAENCYAAAFQWPCWEFSFASFNDFCGVQFCPNPSR